MTNKNQTTKNAIQKGWGYLDQQNNNGFFKCYIGPSRDLLESYLSPPETSNMLIAEVLLKHHPKNKITIDTMKYLRELANNELLTYFEDRKLYPPDSDVNAVGYSILFESGYIKQEDANKFLSTLLSNTNEDGIVQVWITDSDRPKHIDHVVAANIVYFAYLLGREKEIIKSIDWIYQILQTKQYLSGSRYYNSPNAFLFAISRIANKFASFDNRFKGLLYESIKQRIGQEEHPIDIAMVIIITKYLDIDITCDQEKLLHMQNDDGSWPADALFKFGSDNKYFGSKALTTAYAIRALEI
jgi:hypothetical protein